MTTKKITMVAIKVTKKITGKTGMIKANDIYVNQRAKDILVSKRCCYLCELYIDFARKNGYNIIVSENHRKIYSGWKLPHVSDDNFKIESLRHILENLDRIIEYKLKHYTRNPDSKNLNKGENMNGYLNQIIDELERLP